MKIHFCGTGNAGGIPNPFCCCDVCNGTRNGNTKDRRTRSSVIVNDDLLIDVSPDLSTQLARDKICLSNLKYILITHSHLDHFSMLEFTNIRLAQLDSNNIIQVYGHKDTLNMLNISEGEMHLRATEPNPNMRKFYDIRSLEFYNTIQIGDYKATTIPSNHLLQKNSMDFSKSMEGANFIIEYKNETLLYAVDKDVYSESTLDFVKNFKFDKIIIDCNDGFLEKKSNHQNINEVKDFLHYLYRFNSIDMETPIYLSHITHNMSHFEFEKRLKDYTFNIKLAYDGLDIV